MYKRLAAPNKDSFWDKNVFILTYDIVVNFETFKYQYQGENKHFIFVLEIDKSVF